MMIQIYKTYILCLMQILICAGMAKAGCNNANFDSYTLILTGCTIVSEANSLTFIVSVIPSTAPLDNPQWTVTKKGSPTETLKDCAVTPSQDGLSATIVFYWYPGVEPGKYEVKFDSGGTGTATDCTKKMTVTVLLPAKGAETSANNNGVYSTSVVTIDYVKLNSAGWTCSDPETDWNIPDTSPFMEGRDGRQKIPEHEAKHVSDNTGGTEAPAAIYGASVVSAMAEPFIGVAMELDDYFALKNGFSTYTRLAIKEWLEDRAYEISDQIWPTCYYQDPGPGNR